MTGARPHDANLWWVRDEPCTLGRVRALYEHRRVVAPLVAAVACLIVADFSGPIVAWITLIATFGFILDAVTIAWPKGDNLTKYRQ